MRILTLDIGTGTQDIVLYDSEREPENCFKMVMPAPTQIQAAAVRRATLLGSDIVLAGSLMGGGPVGWAVEAHLRARLRVYAEAAAARTLNDDLERVKALGIQLVAPGERPAQAQVIELKDLDLATVARALAAFGLPPDWDGLAVAVLDHGDAPPGVSDRAFRFQHIRRVAETNRGRRGGDPALPLLAFAYTRSDLPPILTRMASVAACAPESLPLVLLDTGPAAALGALQDPRVSIHRNLMLVNAGNMHALTIHLADGELGGILEHHTGKLTPDRLAAYVRALAAGLGSDEEVFADHGHGCYQSPRTAERRVRPFVAVTGPRRREVSRLLRGADFAPGSPCFTVPHGDMMTAGCWGLVRAFAHRYEAWAPEILRSLSGGSKREPLRDQR